VLYVTGISGNPLIRFPKVFQAPENSFVPRLLARYWGREAPVAYAAGRNAWVPALARCTDGGGLRGRALGRIGNPGKR
jgi:hypothetical protein